MRPCRTCQDQHVIRIEGKPDKLCPECQTPTLTALRSSGKRDWWRRHVVKHSTVKSFPHSLLLFLAGKCDHNGVIEMSFAEIAANLRRAERAIRHDVHALLNAGELVTIEKGCGRGNVSRYSMKGANFHTIYEVGNDI